MVLIAFDVDGTLDSSNGPVPVEALAKMKNCGTMICIVSPSSARPVGRFAEYIAGPARRDNLLAAKAASPGLGFYLYVSDNNDQIEADAAGFAFMHPTDFVKGL